MSWWTGSEVEFCSSALATFIFGVYYVFYDTLLSSMNRSLFLWCYYRHMMIFQVILKNIPVSVTLEEVCQSSLLTDSGSCPFPVYFILSISYCYYKVQCHKEDVTRWKEPTESFFSEENLTIFVEIRKLLTPPGISALFKQLASFASRQDTIRIHSKWC